MPQGVKEIILQAAYDWINEVISPPDPDNQILFPTREDDPAHLPAPSPPFVTMNLSAMGQRSSSNAVRFLPDGATGVEEEITQAKRGTLSLRLVGEEAEDWGHILSVAYERFPAEAASISDVLAFTDTSYVSEDGQMLRRHELDLELEYYLVVCLTTDKTQAEKTAITHNAGDGELIIGEV